MKKFLAALLIFVPTLSFAQPYFNTLYSDPLHPKISATALFTSKADFDGTVGDVALVYHKANPEDSLWPRALLNAGFPPISWTLWEIGAGGDGHSSFVHTGASLDIAPTLLGPLVGLLHRAGDTASRFGDILANEDGSGLRIGLGWKGNVIENGDVLRFNRWRFAPRYGVGYSYVF